MPVSILCQWGLKPRRLRIMSLVVTDDVRSQAQRSGVRMLKSLQGALPSELGADSAVEFSKFQKDTTTVAKFLKKKQIWCSKCLIHLSHLARGSWSDSELSESSENKVLLGYTVTSQCVERCFRTPKLVSPMFQMLQNVIYKKTKVNLKLTSESGVR